MEIIKENEDLAEKNKDVMVCWCCEQFIWHDPTDEGACISRRCIVSAHQIVCPDFIWRSGITTRRKIPDHCVHYPNFEK